MRAYTNETEEAADVSTINAERNYRSLFRLLVALLEVVAVICIARFAWLIWWPLPWLVVGIAGLVKADELEERLL
jgi:fatty acid desaturase